MCRAGRNGAWSCGMAGSTSSKNPFPRGLACACSKALGWGLLARGGWGPTPSRGSSLKRRPSWRIWRKIRPRASRRRRGTATIPTCGLPCGMKRFSRPPGARCCPGSRRWKRRLWVSTSVWARSYAPATVKAAGRLSLPTPRAFSARSAAGPAAWDSPRSARRVGRARSAQPSNRPGKRRSWIS